MAGFALNITANINDALAGISQLGRELRSLGAGKALDLGHGINSVFGQGGSAQKFSEATRGLQLAFAGLAAGVTAFGAAGLRAFAADEQAASRLNATFGKLSGSVDAFTEDFSKSAQRGKGDIQLLVSQAATFLHPLDLSVEKTAELSQELTKMAVGASKAFGADTAAVMDAFRGGLNGVGKGLLEYGIKLNDVSVKAAAAKLGFDPENLSEQEAGLARLKVILSEFARIMGLAGAQSDSLTEKSVQLASAVVELSGDFGGVLAPAAKVVVDGFKDATNAAREWIQSNTGLAESLRGIAASGVDAAKSAASFSASNPKIAATGTIAAVAAGGIAVLGAAAGLASAAFNNIVVALGTAGTALGIVSGAAAKAVGASYLLAASMAALSGAVAVAGSALAGWYIGKKIQELTGLNDALTRVQNGTASWTDQIYRGVAAVTTFGESEKQLKENIANISSAQKDVADGTEKLIATFAEGSPELARFNELISQGASRWKAATQAAREQVEAENKLAEARDETGGGKDAASQKQAVVALTDREKKLLEEIRGVEDGIADARVKATAEIEDDITLINQRREAAYLEAQSTREALLIDKKANIEVAQVRAEAEQKIGEAATKAAQDAADAELATEEARLKATGGLEAEIELLKVRLQLELDAAKSEGERAGIRQKFAAQETALREADARKNAEDQKRLDDEAQARAQSATQETVNAELELLDARAKSTETLEDDFAVMEKRKQLVLDTAKSQAEADAIEKRFLIEKLKLIEDTARRQKQIDDEERKRAKQALNEFAKGQQNASDRRAGRGAEVDVRETLDGLRKQLGNVKDFQGANEFSKAAKQNIDGVLSDLKDKADSTFNDFLQAQNNLKTGKFGSSAERRAAQDDVADKRAAAQKAGSDFLSAQDQAGAGLRQLLDAAQTQGEQGVKTQGAESQTNALTDAAKGLMDGVKSQFDDMTAAVAKGVSAMAEMAKSVDVLPKLGEQFDKMAEAQAKFTDGLNKFGDTVSSKLTEIVDRFNNVTERLDINESDIRALRLPRDNPASRNSGLVTP